MNEGNCRALEGMEKRNTESEQVANNTMLRKKQKTFPWIEYNASFGSCEVENMIKTQKCIYYIHDNMNYILYGIKNNDRNISANRFANA